MSSSVPEAAEPTTIEECRKCGEKPGKGVSWVEQGILYFRCDACGRTLWEGVLEEVNREQVEQKRLNEKANDNRSRYLREFEEKMRGDYKRFQDDLTADPYAVLQSDAEYLFHQVLP